MIRTIFPPKNVNKTDKNTTGNDLVECPNNNPGKCIDIRWTTLLKMYRQFNNGGRGLSGNAIYQFDVPANLILSVGSRVLVWWRGEEMQKQVFDEGTLAGQKDWAGKWETWKNGEQMDGKSGVIIDILHNQNAVLISFDDGGQAKIDLRDIRPWNLYDDFKHEIRWVKFRQLLSEKK